MAEGPRQPQDLLTATGAAGFTVRLGDTLQVVTLRYFSGDGEFASAVREVSGLALPGIQEATIASDGQLILAWRSPTETLCLLQSAAQLAQLAARVADAEDGCLVNLSGGMIVVRISGTRTGELLCRLGGTASVPHAGEARRSRLADVPVLALCAGNDPTEMLLLVDRAYAPHLLGWIRETMADFT
jgi:heterotetrameric sarcosine oxidase gamma subunit